VSYSPATGDDLNSRAVRGGGWLLVGRLGSVIRFAVTAVLLMLLSPADFGLFGMGVVFLALAGQFRNIGLHAAIIQRRQPTEAELSSVFWVNLAVGALLTLAVAAAAPVVAGFYGEAALVPLVVVLSLDLFLRSSFQVPDALMRRRLNFKVFAFVDIGASAVCGGVAIVLAMAGLGVWALAARALLLSVLTAIVFWAAVDWRPRFHFSYVEARPYLMFGLPLLGVGILVYLHKQFDFLLIGKMLGKESLGYYTMAYTIVLLPAAQIAQPLGSLTFPLFSAVQDERERVARHYLLLLKSLAAVVFPGLTGLAIIAPTAVPALLGDKWTPAVLPLQILCIVGIMQALYDTVQSVFRSQGRSGLELRTYLLFVLVILGSFAVGVRWGVVGLCISYGVAMTCVTPFVLRKAVSLLGLGLWDVGRSLAAPVSSTALMAVSVLGLGWARKAGLLWSSDYFYIVAAVIVGAGVYAGGILVFAGGDLRRVLRIAARAGIKRRVAGVVQK